jgi:preprotein translocase subunit SecG
VVPVLLAAATPVAKAATALPNPAATVPGAAQVPQALQNFNFQYQPQTALQQHAGWLTHTFAGFFIICALALIVLLAVQTTKQEGLSGTLGGRVESSYRGRLGFEGQIARLNEGVAIAFVVVATLVSLSGI